MQQIGWVIRQKAKSLVHLNVKVYDTEKRAQRYAHGGEVIPVYIQE